MSHDLALVRHIAGSRCPSDSLSEHTAVMDLLRKGDLLHVDEIAERLDDHRLSGIDTPRVEIATARWIAEAAGLTVLPRPAIAAE